MLKKKYMVLSEHVTKWSNLIVGEWEKKVVNNDLSQDLNNEWELSWSVGGVLQGGGRGRGSLVERTAPFMALWWKQSGMLRNNWYDWWGG